MALRLAREEAILGGGSGGVAVHAAIEVGRRLGPGKRVVTLIADTGRNYLSTYFSRSWRERHGL
jgi:cysteine synthase A